MSHAHFKGKEALEHVIEARQKGKAATEELHGEVLPGHLSAFADSAKDLAFLLLGLWILPLPSSTFPFIGLLAIGWLTWKTGRSALLGWARLERLHRLIEEERWEIEHHRGQEREELHAFYEAKGFSGDLLEEVIDVLMADDNRLLQVMLQEELGLSLESQEHPLKQALGAFLGGLFSCLFMAIGYLLFPSFGPAVIAILLIAIPTALAASWERCQASSAIVWNLAVAGLAISAIYFTAKLLLSS